MTNYDFRYAAHPVASRAYGTDELRNEFLIPKLFVKNSVQLTYSIWRNRIQSFFFRIFKIRKFS